MAIRYNKEFNSDIRRIVSNYNAKLRYLEKQNFKNIPERTTSNELKARYSNRSDLKKELKRMEGFRKRDLVSRVETQGGIKAVPWQLDFIKANTQSAKEYFQREYERINKRLGKYPGERTYLDNVRAKLNFLERDVNYMNQPDIRTTLSIINEFAIAPTVRKHQYRGYLTEVDWLMEKLGYDEKERKRVFSKFSQLTPSQFLYAYDQNAIIGRIYGLYHKDYGDEEGRLTATEGEAKDLLEEFIGQIDVIIEDAKENMD